MYRLLTFLGMVTLSVFVALGGVSMFLTTVLTAGFVWFAATWLDRQTAGGLYGMAVFGGGMILVSPFFWAVALLMYPLILLVATNELIRKDIQRRDLINDRSDSSGQVIAPLLNGDYGVGLTTLRSALLSTQAVVVIPFLFFVLHGIVWLILVGPPAPADGVASVSVFVNVWGAYSMFSSAYSPSDVASAALANDVATRILVVLPMLALALFRMHDRPVKLYISLIPVLSLFLATLGPFNTFTHVIPELIFIISVIGVLMTIPSVGSWINHLAVTGAVIATMFVGYPFVVQSSVADQITQRFSQLSELRLPADLWSWRAAEKDSLPAVAAVTQSASAPVPTSTQPATTQPAPVPAPTPTQPAATSAPTPAPTSTQPAATSAATQPAAVTAPTPAPTPTQPAATSAVTRITWNDTQRYYFEVQITSSTGAAARRNYERWKERAGAENVTLMPQYRQDRLIRWVVGTDRYQTFQVAATVIRELRGQRAFENAYVLLYHYTDFRIFGDAPNYDPSKAGFTIRLGTFESESRALAEQQAWRSVGLNQTRIVEQANRYVILTGRYPEKAEAELLGMIITQKSGRTVDVEAIP